MSQSKLREQFHYNPDTGEFRRRPAMTKAGSMSRGYLQVSWEGRPHQVHRLIFMYMTGAMPKNEVDHINGVRSDNRWENLRDATKIENMRNCRPSKRNRTGITGISKEADRPTWCVSFQIGKKIKKHRYADFFEACCARKSFELRRGYHENHGKKMPLSFREGQVSACRGDGSLYLARG